MATARSELPRQFRREITLTQLSREISIMMGSWTWPSSTPETTLSPCYLARAMVRSRRPRVHPTRFLRERPRSLRRISTTMENSILRLPETVPFRFCFSNNTTGAGTASLHQDLAGHSCVVFRVFHFQWDLAGCTCHLAGAGSSSASACRVPLTISRWMVSPPFSSLPAAVRFGLARISSDARD